jgi:hypothetical protein
LHVDDFLSELQKGNIRVYEETIMFKAIRLIPKFIVKDVVKNPILNSTVEKLRNDTEVI